jgi:serine/threonine protein kinase
LHYWKIEDVIVEKYKWTKEEAKEIASFIMPMLEYDTDKRATAAEMLKHKWIQNAHPLLDSEPKS